MGFIIAIIIIVGIIAFISIEKTPRRDSRYSSTRGGDSGSCGDGGCGDGGGGDG